MNGTFTLNEVKFSNKEGSVRVSVVAFQAGALNLLEADLRSD